MGLFILGFVASAAAFVFPALDSHFLMLYHPLSSFFYFWSLLSFRFSFDLFLGRVGVRLRVVCGCVFEYSGFFSGVHVQASYGEAGQLTLFSLCSISRRVIDAVMFIFLLCNRDLPLFVKELRQSRKLCVLYV